MKKFPDNPRAGGNTRFYHHDSKESLDGIRADIHPARDLFTCHPAHHKLDGFAFTLRQVILVRELRNVHKSFRIPLDQNGRGHHRALGVCCARFEMDAAAHIMPFARRELPRGSRFPGTRLAQEDGSKPLCQNRAQGFTLSNPCGIRKNTNRFGVRINGFVGGIDENQPRLLGIGTCSSWGTLLRHRHVRLGALGRDSGESVPEPLNENLAEGWVSGVADLPRPSRAETNRGEVMYRFEPENARIREKLYVPAYTKARILIADDPRINADGTPISI
jgi:hypothetical protein